MKKSLVLLLTLVLSLCIGLGTAQVASGSATSGAAVAWLDWSPGTPPASNVVVKSGIAWLDWSPGTPPTSNIIVNRGPGL